jgi:hypothetical protein
MQLQYVPTQDIGVYWDKIKPSLKNMARSWRVEDAYCELKEGRASLFLTIEDKYNTGYVILQQQGLSLHIWAAYNEKNNVLESGLDLIKELAQQYNLKHITFKSYRKAWNKVAPQLGFKQDLWSYDV